MKLYLVRHLPTGYNRAGLIQGRRDEPILNPDPELEQDIARTRRRLQHRGAFEHVLVSRLQRTAMTAQAYGFQDQARVEPLLDELDFGPYEAGPRTDMLQALGSRWLDRPRELLLGEPMTELEARVSAFLDRYAGAKSVLAFGHAAWIRACVSLVRYGDINHMNRMSVANNELVELEF